MPRSTAARLPLALACLGLALMPLSATAQSAPAGGSVPAGCPAQPEAGQPSHCPPLVNLDP